MIKKLIGQIFFPRIMKFSKGIHNYLNSSSEEINNFDIEIRNICMKWLIFSPYHYFNSIFIDRNQFNYNIIELFFESKLQNPHYVFIITQAYFLRHLLRLVDNNPFYKNISSEQIIRNIECYMKYSKDIINIYKEFKFKIDNENSNIEDLPLYYIEKILLSQSINKDKIESLIKHIVFNIQLSTGITIFTSEFLIECIEIDKEHGINSISYNVSY